MSCPYVFVYGTLKQGFSNNYLLKDATLVGPAVTTIQGVLKDWGAPCFVPEPWLPEDGSMDSLMRPVQGEMYSLYRWETLYGLDALEGHPQGYYRTQIWVEGDDFEDWAWCYFYNSDSITKLCPIVNGNYIWRPEETKGVSND